jgi:hypothetical protein
MSPQGGDIGQGPILFDRPLAATLDAGSDKLEEDCLELLF